MRRKPRLGISKKEHQERAAQGAMSYWAKKRGFAVPPELRYDYYILTSQHRMTPQEAGRVLGLIP